MKTTTKLLLALLTIGILTFSCSEDEDLPIPEETTTSTGNTGSTENNLQPTIPGADAALWAVNTVTITEVPGLPSITTNLGVGVAVFLDASGDFVDVGDVQLNTNSLDRVPNNSYVSIVGITNPTGIDFSGGVSWSVVGGNGFPAITKDVAIGFPNVGEITSSTTVTPANGYTLTVSSVSGADSVLFLIEGINKTIAGNATSCTFTASDLSSLSAGASIVQVAAYVTTNETVDGKTIYYGNQTVQTKSVTIQ